MYLITTKKYCLEQEIFRRKLQRHAASSHRAGSRASQHANVVLLGQPWHWGTPKVALSVSRFGASHQRNAARLPKWEGAHYWSQAGLGWGVGTGLAQADHEPRKESWNGLGQKAP